ncbi:MAG: amidase [Comamonas sp.]
MNTQAWWKYSAQELRTAYLEGRATPVQVLESCLARMAQVQPQLNAFVYVRSEAVLAEAVRSTERYAQGASLGPLDGIPVSIKDNLLTADMPTVWGSPGLRDHPPQGEESVVQRLRAQGALIVGKTNVPEFTLEGYTDNPVFGVSRNPWDVRLTPGGSSGGAAASVAAGCTPLALGTDGGGSIRRPAAHCGLVGLKPSIGTLARVQCLPSLLLDFEVVGLLARSVEDVQLALDALAGPEAADAASLAAYAARACQVETKQPLKVLYVADLDGAPVDPEIAQACGAAVQLLADQAVIELQHSALPLNLSTLNSGWSRVGQMGLAHLFAQHPEWAQQASAKYRDMAAQGQACSAADLWSVLEAVAQLRRDCVALFTAWDVIAMPATAAQPWPAEQAYPTEIAGVPVGPRGHAVFTGWVNAAGLPAVSVPVQPDAQGLPIGLQLIGPLGSESRLLRLAQQLQQAQGGPMRQPPV